MRNEMTYVMALDVAINGMMDGEAKDKLIALKDTIAKRKSAPSKKKVAEMDARVNAVYEALLAHDEPISAGDLFKADFADKDDFSVQRISALLTKLYKDGRVVKTVEKRKSFYAITE